MRRGLFMDSSVIDILICYLFVNDFRDAAFFQIYLARKNYFITQWQSADYFNIFISKCVFIFESMIFISNSFWNVQVIQSCRILESKSISTLFSMTYNFIFFRIMFLVWFALFAAFLFYQMYWRRRKLPPGISNFHLLTLSLWICRSRSIPPDRKFANNVEICWARIWSLYQIKVDVSIKVAFLSKF